MAKSKTRTIQIELSDEDHILLLRLAKKRKCSFNKLVNNILIEMMEKWEKNAKAH